MWYHAVWVRDPRFGPRVTRIARIGQHIFYVRAARVPPPRPGPPLLFASR
jgi:hypothetical protein